jgi:cytochrome c-type biogenesis protein CcmH/NrfG
MTNEDKLKYLRSDFERKTVSGQLEEVENWLGKLDSNNQTLAQKILDELDLIDKNIKNEFSGTEIPLQYQTQLNYIYQRIQTQAKMILSALGGTAQLKKKRQAAGKKEDAWWWYLDDYIRSNQKKSFRKTLTIVGIIAVLGAALFLVYERYFAPPPEVKARLAHEQAADRLVEAREFEAALAEIEAALVFDPDSYELWAWKGVIYLNLGDLDLAETAFQESQKLAGDQEAYYTTKAYFEFISGMVDAGLADAHKVVEINPQSAEGYMYIGQGYESKGELDKAYSAYEKASELAETSENAELIATIRVRMGMLLQSMPINAP